MACPFTRNRMNSRVGRLCGNFAPDAGILDGEFASANGCANGGSVSNATCRENSVTSSTRPFAGAFASNTGCAGNISPRMARQSTGGCSSGCGCADGISPRVARQSAGGCSSGCGCAGGISPRIARQSAGGCSSGCGCAGISPRMARQSAGGCASGCGCADGISPRVARQSAGGCASGCGCAQNCGNNNGACTASIRQSSRIKAERETSSIFTGNTAVSTGTGVIFNPAQAEAPCRPGSVVCNRSIEADIYGASNNENLITTTCCDALGCRLYRLRDRNPFWPDFAHPRWLNCNQLYARRR